MISYAGESLGAVYLAEKASGPEFTAEDEETLVMFASQASLVMANSRRYRDKQRARAEEMELRVPNSRSVTVLVSATPTWSPCVEAKARADGSTQVVAFDSAAEEIGRALDSA